jgi:hypothetical protein
VDWGVFLVAEINYFKKVSTQIDMIWQHLIQLQLGQLYHVVS